MDTIGDTHVRLYPLSLVDEGEEVLIGRMEVESYAVFPADAAEVVRKLQGGSSVEQASAWYESTYGEPADIEDLIEMLRDLQFVQEDGDEGTDVAVALRWTRLARALFSVPAWIVYGLITATGVYSMVRWSNLRPAVGHTFFTPLLLIVVLTVMFAQIPGIAWHEGYHVLAGRRLGLSARVNIGRRLYFVVFQTTLTGLMSVPRSKRILPFCAGLVADCTYLNLMVCIAAFEQWRYGSLDIVGRVALAIAFITFLRMVWQFMVFMETDMYYVIATAVYCPDLHRMTREYIGARVRRVLRRPARPTSEGTWTDRDRKIVRRYAPVVLGGGVIAVTTMILGTIPLFYGLAVRMVDALATGDPLSVKFWNGLLVGAGTFFEVTVVAVLAVRGRRQRPETQRPGGS